MRSARKAAALRACRWMLAGLSSSANLFVRQSLQTIRCEWPNLRALLDIDNISPFPRSTFTSWWEGKRSAWLCICTFVPLDAVAMVAWRVCNLDMVGGDAARNSSVVESKKLWDVARTANRNSSHVRCERHTDTCLYKLWVALCTANFIACRKVLLTPMSPIIELVHAFPVLILPAPRPLLIST